MNGSGPLERERNAALLDWFRDSDRPLPWRGTRDRYALLVSEVMCQQTQAERVVPFYERFMDAFPTVDSLAAAPLADVLVLWNGLGYNSRAKRLHEAANQLAEHGWPDDPAELAALPGVGPYTARALAAFGYGRSVAAVDTNVARVVSRWYGSDDIRSVDALAATALADADAARWNQAVMDLGAAICRARRPGCGRCPVADWCAGPGDPVAARTHARFEGSRRQLRGAIMRRLVRGPAGFGDLCAETGFASDDVEAALEDLVDEGLVDEDGGRFGLPS